MSAVDKIPVSVAHTACPDQGSHRHLEKENGHRKIMEPERLERPGIVGFVMAFLPILSLNFIHCVPFLWTLRKYQFRNSTTKYLECHENE